MKVISEISRGKHNLFPIGGCYIYNIRNKLGCAGSYPYLISKGRVRRIEQLTNHDGMLLTRYHIKNNINKRLK